MAGKALRRLARDEPVAAHLLPVDLAFDDELDQMPGRDPCEDRSVCRREVFRRKVLHRPTIAAVGYESSTLQFCTAARSSTSNRLFRFLRDLIEIENCKARVQMERPNLTSLSKLTDSAHGAAEYLRGFFRSA